MSRYTLVLLSGTVLAAPASAQQRQIKTEPATYSMAKEYRGVQLSAIKAQRKLLLSMADSMPERLYRDKATPAQRDFAGQISHVVTSNGFIATAYLSTSPRKAEPVDTGVVLNSRSALKAFIDREYDYLEGLLNGQSDADRDVRIEFFNRQMMPRWQVWDELNQHAIWTAGQIVANFRKHGMAPPPFLFF